MYCHRDLSTGGCVVVAYYGFFEYAAHCGTRWMAIRSTDGGQTWSEPALMLERFVPNLGPQTIASGRLIVPGGVVFPFTDDTAGLSGWTRAALPGRPCRPRLLS